MTIKVHGNPISTATMRVVACLIEKDLDFEFVFVDMATGEHKKHPFLSLNVSTYIYLCFVSKIHTSVDLCLMFMDSCRILI